MTDDQISRIEAALEAGPVGHFTTTRGTDAAYDFTADDIRALLVEVERLRAELATAQQDAVRYRWMRGDSCPDHSVRWTQWEVRCWRAPFWTDDLRRGGLDAAIDAAMIKEPACSMT